MTVRHSVLIALSLAALPFLIAAKQDAQNQTPTCEQVYKNIKAFNGVPAKDLIPSMEFMSAALKYKCSSCHDPKDFAAETRAKETTRRMITMQREINKTHFEGRNSITCMSCHNGHEKPTQIPVPEGSTIRHKRVELSVKPDELFKKHIAAVGAAPAMVTLKGMMTSPNEETGKDVIAPIEMVQANDGRYRMTSIMGKVGNDGKSAWMEGYPLQDEQANFFNRIGKTWRGSDAFDGLEKTSIYGKEMLGKISTTLVRGTRTSTGAMEELYFDDKSGMLVRFINITRSSLGSVVTVYDYADYKTVKGTKVPMKLVVTVASGEKFSSVFKAAEASDKATDSMFAMSK